MVRFSACWGWSSCSGSGGRLVLVGVLLVWGGFGGLLGVLVGWPGVAEAGLGCWRGCGALGGLSFANVGGGVS